MLAQLIGFVGFIFLGISNLKKDRKSIIIFMKMILCLQEISYLKNVLEEWI